MYQEIRKLSYAFFATFIFFVGAFILFGDSAKAAIGINKQINFQGKVTNTDGTNVATGSYTFVFNIYSVSSGGSSVWTETKSLTVTDGIFQTNLGDTTTLPGSVDFNTDNIFLGINFNSNGEMSPRVQFTASPYSFNSDLLDGKDWTNPGTIGTSASTLALASNGTSAWTNTSGNLTFSTATSGTLALTSAGALNLSASSASTMTLGNITNSFNIDSNTLSIDALNNRIGIGTAGPTAFLDIASPTTGAASIRLEASAGVNPSAPNIGDMWFNGSNLYFRKDGSTSQDLLAGGGGGMTNPMTTAGDLIFGGTSGAPTRLAGSVTNGYVLKYSTGTNSPYWGTDLTGGGGGAWTLDANVEYLTTTTEDLAVGGTTLASPFSVDVSLNTTRIGSGATNNGILDMFASNGATGSLEYTTNDSWNFSGGNVGIGIANTGGAMFDVYKDFNPTFADGSNINISSINNINTGLNISYVDPNSNLGGDALVVQNNGGGNVASFQSAGNLGNTVLNLASTSTAFNSNSQLINGYSDSITTNALINLGQSTSAFSGDGLRMNFDSSGINAFTGNFLKLQKNGVDKFLVSNNGGVTVNGGDSSIVKQTAADFAMGTIGSSLTNADGALSLSDTVAGGIPNAGKGTITTGMATTSAAIGAGAFSITRADGKYLVIRGGASTGMDVYDPVTETFTSSAMVLNAAAGVGAIALPRSGGLYRIIHGGNALTTSLVDPMGSVMPGVSVAVTAKGAGTVAFLRADGKFLVTSGSLAGGVTQIYEPIGDTFVTGPTNTTATAWGVGAVVLNRNDGQALILVGGASAATQLYDPNAGALSAAPATPIGAFTAGPALDGKQAAGTCALNGSGSVAFRRQDGKFVVLSKANVWTVYDPNANDFTCNASGGPATAIGDGGHAIPLQDGKFLIIVGGGSTASYVYNPAGDSFTLHGTALTAVTSGAHSIMESDGIWHIINGGGTATNEYNTGLPMNGSTAMYTSEDIFSSNLNSNSSLWWRAQMEAVYSNAANGAINTAFSTLQFIVKTAVSSDGTKAGCATPLDAAGEEEIKSSGDLIGTAFGANCIRVKIKYNRPVPRRLFDERGVWVGNGMVVSRYDEITPRLYNFKIDNSAVLKRSNFDFSSANASAPTNPTIPAALTATQSAGGGTCTAGTHAYYSTFITNGVESQLSTKSNVITCAGGTDKVNLTVIPLGPAGTTARKIYRTAAGDTGSPMLVTTIADNTTTTLTSDTAADTALGAAYTLVENSGPVMTKSETRVETVNGNLVLPYGRLTQTSQIGTTGYYMGLFSNAHPTLTNPITAGSTVIARDDKTFLIIEAGGQFAELYDPASETFINQIANGDKPTGIVGAGVFALKRADGKFLVYLGLGATTTTCTTAGTATNIYDPNKASGSHFTNGPCLTAAGGIGAQAILNNDGSYTIMHGNQTTATSIYNQMTNTMIVGPITPTAISCGSWAIPMGLPNNNQYKVKVGAAPGVAGNAVSLNYDANSKVFVTGTAFTGSTTVGCGSMAFQRQDGYWVVTSGETAGAVQTTSSIINPITGLQVAGPALTVGAGRGSSVIPRADGTFLIILGNAVANGNAVGTQIYFPTAGAIATGLTVPMGSFAAGPAIMAGAAPGTIATGALAAGTNLGIGAYYYKYTYVTNGVESLASTTSAAVTTTAANQAVTVTVTAGPTGTTARKIYRTALAGTTGPWKYVGTIADNTTLTFADTYADTSIGGVAGIGTGPGTAAVAGTATAGGSITAGTHSWVYTYVSNGVETLPSAASTAPTIVGGTQTMPVTVTAGPAGTTSRRIYRTIAGNTGAYRYVGTIADNTTLIFTDDIADAQLGTNSAPGGPSDGAVSFQRPDGKFVIVFGGSATATGNTTSTAVDLYDAGWYSDGQYMSEMMQVPALAANATLEWQKTADPFARFEVRTASSQTALGSATFKGVDNPGASINNAGGETWAQVEINFRREFPTFCGNMNGVYLSGAGMAFCGRNIALPTILQYQITNGQDLLSLQTNSYNVLRVTSNGGIYSSQQGGFFAGGADLAENYTSNEQLEKGEIVSVDPADNHNVKRSQTAYQKDVLGIVSTAPGFVAGSYTENSYPIALVGRVPVNVTTENGMIKAGDRITSASLAGFGMRATVAGRVVGTALESMDLAKLGACPAGGIGGINTKCGQIMVFVNLTDYQGMSAEQLMSEVESSNLSVDNNAVVADATPSNSPFAQFTAQGKVLNFLETLKDSQATTNGSDIFTKNINVTNQIVSPLIVTDTLVAKHIKAESIEGLEFIQTGIDSANDAVASNTTEVKTLGQQLADLQSNIKLLNEKVLGIGTSVATDVKNETGLSAPANPEFKAPTFFKAVAEFFDKVIFKNNVEFADQVMFNNDSAGYAIIKEGTDLVDITFEKEYQVAPIVNASVSLQLIADEQVREAAEQLLLLSDVKFVITNVTTKGLQIRIGQKAVSDIPFSWQAIAIKDAKTFQSKIPMLAIEQKDLFGDVKNVVAPAENTTRTVEALAPALVENLNINNTQQVAGVENANVTN